ncbi:nicotinamide riboside transporter PnuC [Coprobacter sp.]
MNYLELCGTLVGLLYLWLEYRANVYLWLASIVMPAIYIFIYYQAGLYADFGINIYYLFAAVYGWYVWLRGNKKVGNISGELPITNMPLRYYTPLVILLFLTFIAIGWILISYTDSDVPWWDSFTTALSMIALWMLAHKYVEQWLAWIAVDIVCCGLYVYKGLYFTSFLYGIYTVVAIFGYFKWKKLM